MRLTDLLAILLTLAVLAALILPKIEATSRCPRYDRVRSEMSAFEELLERFKLDCGRYPTKDEGLAALQRRPSGLEGKWAGPYTDRTNFHDRWGNPYLYESNGKRFTLVSYGADGKHGGKGYDADLTAPE